MLFYVQFLTDLINFFLFDFNIAKMHIFCSLFKKITVVSDQK